MDVIATKALLILSIVTVAFSAQIESEPVLGISCIFLWKNFVRKIASGPSGPTMTTPENLATGRPSKAGPKIGAAQPDLGRRTSWTLRPGGVTNIT